MLTKLTLHFSMIKTRTGVHETLKITYLFTYVLMHVLTRVL